MKSILLNVSGHTLQPDTRQRLLEQYQDICEIQVPVIVPREDVGHQLKQFLNDVNAHIRVDQPVSVILPGYSVLAVILVAYLHGLLGYFPEVCILEASSPGVYVPSATIKADIAAIRVAARRVRNHLSDANTAEAQNVVSECISEILKQGYFK